VNLRLGDAPTRARTSRGQAGWPGGAAAPQKRRADPRVTATRTDEPVLHDGVGRGGQPGPETGEARPTARQARTARLGGDTLRPGRGRPGRPPARHVPPRSESGQTHPAHRRRYPQESALRTCRRAWKAPAPDLKPRPPATELAPAATWLPSRPGGTKQTRLRPAETYTRWGPSLYEPC